MLNVVGPLVVLVAALSLSIWAAIFGRLLRREPIVPCEPRRPVPWGAVDLLLIAACWVLVQLIVGSALAAFAGPAAAQVDEAARAASPPYLVRAMLVTSAANLSTLLFAAAVIRLRVGGTQTDLGWNGATVVSDLRLGLLAFIAASLPIYALQAVLTYFFPKQHPIIEALRLHPSGALLWVSLLTAVMVAPLTEEFFFRVLLQGWLESLGPARDGESPVAPAAGGEAEAAAFVPPLEGGLPASTNPYASPSRPVEQPGRGPAMESEIDSRRAGSAWGRRWPYAAVGISSLVFALAHVGHGPAPVPLFFLALVLGYLYQRTHRLLPSLVVHFCLNAASMALLWTMLPV